MLVKQIGRKKVHMHALGNGIDGICSYFVAGKGKIGMLQSNLFEHDII